MSRIHLHFMHFYPKIKYKSPAIFIYREANMDERISEQICVPNNSVILPIFSLDGPESFFFSSKIRNSGHSDS